MSSLVPNGWSQIKIGDIGSFFGGLTGKTAKDFGEGHPFLTYMQVYLQQTSDVEAMNSVHIDEGEKQNAVAYGDILFTTSSETPDEIGMTDVFLQNNQTPYLNSFCFGLRPITPSPIDPTFAKYVFRGDDFREDMRPLAQGSTRFNLSKGNLAKLSLLVPPLPEQKKIASILTSVDEVIENTQKQIDKLQDLKKATMNELLTKGIGHTEFKDSELERIPESWYSKRLGDVASIIMGQSPTSDTYNDNDNGTPFFQGKADFGVKHPNVRYWCTSPTKIAPVDSILFSVRAPVGAVNLNNVKACIGRGLASISGKSIDNTFLYQSLIHAKVKFEALGQGSTFEAINGNELKEFSLACPPLQEQKKIASILTSMDKNIEEKQRKLQQTQSLKKSLMQDLLTGKVRVRVN